mmetsp:Transcript_15482/g.28833  ORF Transcript_15482/g.28833 Transcript_15482/m.28833 type:complete len:145 (+) Transcript_15482:1563-1997(+)
MHLLINDLLPLALEFKDDRVTNVRLSLRKSLLLMPNEVTQLPAFKEALRSLEEEVETWESFDGMETPFPAPPPPLQPLLVGNAPGVEVSQTNGMAATPVDDVRDTGALTPKGSKKKTTKRDKKKGGENLQEQGNVVQSEKMASI